MQLRLGWARFAVASFCLMCAAAHGAQNATVAYFGVGLPALLAAFAGSGTILSFLPAREGGAFRVLGTVAFCALFGAYGTPTFIKWATQIERLPVFAELFVAFTSAAVSQVVIPLAIERRAEIWAWASSWLPKRNQGG